MLLWISSQRQTAFVKKNVNRSVSTHPFIMSTIRFGILMGHCLILIPDCYHRSHGATRSRI